MLGPDSRYRDNEDRMLERPDSGQVVYRERRLLPASSDHLITQSVERDVEERIDQLANRTLGSPDAYWQLCDANGVMNPREITQRPRNIVLVPAPLFKVTR